MAASQHELDGLFASPEFVLPSRSAVVLNSVFVTMAFCGGVPLLLPIAAVTFWLMFSLDKMLLIKFYRKPPQYDASLGEQVASFLPWALVLHLLFSTWMYGDARPERGGSDFGYNVHSPKLHMPAGRVSTALLGSVASGSDKAAAQRAYDELLQTARDYDPMGENGLVPKVVRLNVFPIFFFAVVLIIGLLFGNALKLPARIFFRLLRMVVQTPFKALATLLLILCVKIPIMLKCGRGRSAKVAVDDDSSTQQDEFPTTAAAQHQESVATPRVLEQPALTLLQKPTPAAAPASPSSFVTKSFTPSKKMSMRERRMLLAQKRRMDEMEARKQRDREQAESDAAAGNTKSTAVLRMKEHMDKMKSAAMLSALLDTTNGAPSCPDTEFHQYLGADCGNGQLRHSMIPT